MTQTNNNTIDFEKKKTVPHESIMKLAKELISIHSTIDNASEIDASLAFLQKELQEFTIESFKKNDVPSLLIHNAKKGTKQFKIILNAHLDVVAGKSDQFKPIIKKGKLYGRGAYDMKAATAIMVVLFKELAKQIPYPLALQLSTDEENGGFNGVRYQLEKGIRADFVITGECGSNFRIIHEAKGMLRIKLIAAGIASHSAYPWRGENAIVKLHHAIHAVLDEFPSPKEETHETTVNVTHVQTNNLATNAMTPDHCEAILDIRFKPEDEKSVMETIKSSLPEGVRQEIIFSTAPHQTDPKNDYIKLLSKTTTAVLKQKAVLIKAHGTSDMRHFTAFGCDGVEFGPLGGQQHHDDEWVDIQSLEDYYQILKQFLLSVK